ncbi:MAG TPA: recombination mediator RecR [Candidatus Saccharimonadales bacterium]|nr:recombination mediator RecR [Candidatus Saccharimonadales bacterium]
MIDKLPTVKKLMRHLQQVPFLASKNMYRVTSYFLQLDDERIEQFCRALKDAKARVVLCQTCFVWQEQNEQCSFCFDKKREASIICVVETWHELLVIERTEAFAGLYHVLGGVISPLEGVGPKDLKIEELLTRVTDDVVELIFAMNQTPEGEATIAFIARKLQGKKVKISCLAKGIPIGSNLEFVDRLTVGKALADRKLF